MTSKEFYAILTDLRGKHEAEFDRWYDQADYPSIKASAEIGFLLCRYYVTIEKEGDIAQTG